jgi:hypothetical protein
VNEDDVNDGPKAAVLFQPERSFRPDENSELLAKFGFAAGNGLNLPVMVIEGIFSAICITFFAKSDRRCCPVIKTEWGDFMKKLSEQLLKLLSF